MFKISIVIPVIEYSYSLKRLLHTIISQSFSLEEIEIIVVCKNNEFLRGISNEYDNVRYIILNNDNISKAELYNIGIENSSAEYMIFLNPDALLLKETCNILYSSIQDHDFACCNYRVGDEVNEWKFNEDKVIIDSVEDYPEVLKNLTVLDSMIFKRDIILKNNIKFLESCNKFDLIFIYEYILKSTRSIFINEPIVNCPDGNEEHISKKMDFIEHINYFKYIYNLFIDLPFVDFAFSGLCSWTRRLLKSGLSFQDKLDVLYYAKPLFIKFQSLNIAYSPDLREFFSLIKRDNYLEALQLYDSPFEDEIDSQGKNIIILFWGLEEEIGGIAKAVCDRANLLENAGYSVTLISNDPFKNFKFIINKYHDLEYLNDSIDVFNIFDYYSVKNTLNFKQVSDMGEHDTSVKYNIEKNANNDESVTLQYYDDSNNLIKEKIFIDEHLAYEKIFDNDKLVKECYYTCDGFNYFFIDHEHGYYMLFDRQSDCYVSFNNLQEFEDYFVSEICLNSSDKPFLINDCSSRIPSIKNINSDIAYKIGVVHNNPYLKPYRYGSPLRVISSLHDYEHEDAVVVLTDSAKNDFVKEFNATNLHVIPNFISRKDISKCKDGIVKEKNVISIFARIAPEKNISDILLAFKQVLEVHNDAILRIYGRALTNSEILEKNKLDDLIDEWELSDSVIFMGHVDNVYDEMARSLVTVLCSNIEGLPIVILESMINSTPMVSYDINYGPKDVIIDGVNGFIVDQYDIDKLAEVLIDLLNNPDSAVEMGKSAKDHILNNFSEEIVINKWEMLFNDILTK